MGLKWDHRKDTISVSQGAKSEDNNKVTQRLVLSLVAKAFQPVVLVAPFTATAPLLSKDIWRLSGQNWDIILPNEMKIRFTVCSSNLLKFSNLKHP